MFMDTFYYSMDSKGRVSIPSKFRDELMDDFVITKNVDHCLCLYPKVSWDRFTEKLEALPKVSNEAARKLRRFYFANTSTPEVDKAGRILITSKLREYAGLVKEVAFVGVDDHIEIWDKDKWDAYNEDSDIDEVLYGLDGITF